MTNDVGTQFYIDDSDVKDTNLVSSCSVLMEDCKWLILSSCDIPSMIVGVWVGFRRSCI
jgi:hypothetical protein